LASRWEIVAAPCLASSPASYPLGQSTVMPVAYGTNFGGPSLVGRYKTAGTRPPGPEISGARWLRTHISDYHGTLIVPPRQIALPYQRSHLHDPIVIIRCLGHCVELSAGI